MIEIIGNYWDEAKKDSPRYDALVCTTNKMVKNNGRLVMGAGIAKEFKEHFQDLDLIWGGRLRCRAHDNGFMVTSVYTSLGGLRLLHLVAFPTKDDWKHPARIELIKCSALTLENLVNIMGWNNILMTRPGCGMGGLTWNIVKPEISFLNDKFKIITKSADS